MTELELTVTGSDDTQEIGHAIGQILRAGDLVMLNGDLGAGKTTFTQGLGRGLGVRGQVASPTFIVARVHPSLVDGPTLIHVDAYRITSLDDLETLDLDSTMEESVTVVEWGAGKTEGLSLERLEIDIIRETGANVAVNEDGSVDLEGLDNGKRRIVIRRNGTRWDVDAPVFDQLNERFGTRA